MRTRVIRGFNCNLYTVFVSLMLYLPIPRSPFSFSSSLPLPFLCSVSFSVSLKTSWKSPFRSTSTFSYLSETCTVLHPFPFRPLSLVVLNSMFPLLYVSYIPPSFKILSFTSNSFDFCPAGATECGH